jgi:two-component system response regulator YesN
LPQDSIHHKIHQIIHTLLEFNGPLMTIFGADFDPLVAVDACETLADLAGLVQELSKKAVDYIIRYKQDVGKNFVEKAKSYLERNYHDPELSLNMVAEHVYVSSCYLSHLFRQVTGMTISEYLNKVRVTSAQKLLKETPLKIYEIATQVGFNDAHYFGIVFKKITGLSALEYRDKVQVTNIRF